MLGNKNKRGQIWIETVIYTLIAFVLIAALLGVVRPKIEELQDKTIIDQSIGIMKEMHKIFSEISDGGPGNKRIIDMTLTKGNLEIQSQNDTLIFETESSYKYSEEGQAISDGEILITTTQRGENYITTISENYSNIYNITYSGSDISKLIGSSSSSYKVSISNNGKDLSGKTIINFQID